MIFWNSLFFVVLLNTCAIFSVSSTWSNCTAVSSSLVHWILLMHLGIHGIRILSNGPGSWPKYTPFSKSCLCDSTTPPLCNAWILDCVIFNDPWDFQYNTYYLLPFSSLLKVCSNIWYIFFILFTGLLLLGQLSVIRISFRNEKLFVVSSRYF